MTETITWKGKSYPVREEYVRGFGMQMIGTEELEDALIDDASPEAMRMDEYFFFYVSDKDMKRKNLGDFVAKNVF